jgi:serine/threonine-protein kinase HipA
LSWWFALAPKGTPPTSKNFSDPAGLPRHFIQAAEIAGVGAALVRAIKDLAENAAQAIGAAIDELPDGFPKAMTNSIRAAMSHRIDFLKSRWMKA